MGPFAQLHLRVRGRAPQPIPSTPHRVGAVRERLRRRHGLHQPSDHERPLGLLGLEHPTIAEGRGDAPLSLWPYLWVSTPTTSRTAAADSRTARRSSADRRSFTISSMPAAPSFTGTPM